MPRGGPPYRAEFRAEAVRLARSPGHSIDSVAHDLGVARESVRRWARQAQVDRGDAAGESPADDRVHRRLAHQNRPGAATRNAAEVYTL